VEYAEGDDQDGVKIVTTDTTGKTGKGGCSFDATIEARPRVDAAATHRRQVAPRPYQPIVDHSIVAQKWFITMMIMVVKHGYLCSGVSLA
jgi:hypothetical protein